MLIGRQVVLAGRTFHREEVKYPKDHIFALLIRAMWLQGKSPRLAQEEVEHSKSPVEDAQS